MKLSMVQEAFRKVLCSAAKNISKEDIADACRVSPGTINRWMNGRSLPPDYSCNVLKARVLELLATK